MWKRILDLYLSKNESFFLFGARGTGKSTLLKQQFNEKNALCLDLLNLQIEDELARNPQQLEALVNATPKNVSHIIIDEVQKIPRILDVVQHLMSSTNKKFILTGSSARKLRHGAANLLAGRAFVYNLYPFSFLELGNDFHLSSALEFGLMPRLDHLKSKQEKQQFLTAYALTYLREEIWAEQLIKKLDPFRHFLEIAAQMNGKILNLSKISREVNVDDKTISQYYEIVEDTLLGFHLNSFHTSFRKRLVKKPKFYFIDIGIVRALSRSLTLPAQPKTSYYGDLFEAFIIVEFYKLLKYTQPEYRLSFLQTKDDFEIDLILEKPGKKLTMIEIKSTTSVDESVVKPLQRIAEEHDADAFCLSNDPKPKQFKNVLALPWQDGIKKICDFKFLAKRTDEK